MPTWRGASFHVERETEANIARGLSPASAFREARLTVGSVDAALEAARDDRPGSIVRQLGRDMKFGARLLAKSPAFGFAAVTVVALGIGAVAAIFSVVYGVMLRPLPFREPGRLVSIGLSPDPSAAARPRSLPRPSRLPQATRRASSTPAIGRTAWRSAPTELRNDR